ncbi:unnamed protein product [Cylindrotheca closterium]|uniref:SAP domain-containing protein n=1 Tax=Cylindrotheca closterium TaxID=2856 RepID=A0AAD2PV87_9STRA|nr:unnamed protein product [Cylindrotheca closterium]
MDDESLFGADLFGEEPDWANDDYQSQGQDGTEGPLDQGAQHVLMLLDCRVDMFRTFGAGNDKSAMDNGLQVAKALLQDTVRTTVSQRTGKRNGIGIVLFNTKRQTSSKTAMEEEDCDDDDGKQNQGVHILMPLIPPGISHVLDLNQCLEKERNVQEEFQQESQENSGDIMAPLQTALEVCQDMFKKAKCVKDAFSNSNPVVDSKSIWIFTSHDNPYPGALQQMKTIADEAKEQNVKIIVWPMATGGNSEMEDVSDGDSPRGYNDPSFDHSLFYQDIVSSAPFASPMSTMEEFEEALEELRHDYKKPRRAYYGPMRLPDWRKRILDEKDAQDDEDKDKDTAIMIDWFKFVQLAKKPSTVQIDLQTKLETIKVTNLIDDHGEVLATVKRGNTFDRTTSETMQPGLHRIRTFADFAGELVPMSQSEMKELKNAASGKLDSSNLVLLGFRPSHLIPFYHAIDSAYLVYPQVDGNDREAQQDNRNAFINLRAAMIRKNVVAIGEVLFRVGWTSKLVVIRPLHELLDKEEGTQRLPPGLMVVPLPFEDDIREPELDEAMKELRLQSTMAEGLARNGANLEDGGAAPDLTSSLSTSINLMENTHTGYVASEELVQAAMDVIEKRTVDEDIQLGEDLENAALQKFFDYIEAIAMEDPFFEARTEFDTEVPDEDVLKAAGTQIERFKILLPDDAEKPKVAGRKRKMVEDDSGINWVELYEEGALDSCKLPELKKYLRSIGEKLSGKKSDLVLRVQEHIHKSQKTIKVKREI